MHFGGDFNQTLAEIEGLVAAGHAEKPDSYFNAALREIASRADPLRRLSEPARRMWALFLTERRALMNEFQGDAGVDPALDHRRAERVEEVIRLLGEERVELALRNLRISDWLCGRGENGTVKLRPETCFSIAQLEAIAEEVEGARRGRGARRARGGPSIVVVSSPEHRARLDALSRKDAGDHGSPYSSERRAKLAALSQKDVHEDGEP